MNNLIPMKRIFIPSLWLAAFLAVDLAPVSGQFVMERLNSDFNQPIYLSQPVGDSENLFVVERSDSGGIGRILRHELQTGNNTVFLNIDGQLIQDGGLLGLAFHPEFQTNGLLYITLLEGNENRLEEYQANPNDYSQPPALTRTILTYDNVATFHTINWVGFRPGTNELFVTAGDGGPQVNDLSVDLESIESETTFFGKLLRIDLGAAFPKPASDAEHPGVDVVAKGLRNPYRASFSPSGGMFIADVGFTAVEEIDYIPAAHFDKPLNPLLDFGWVDREGTIATVTFNPGIDGIKGPNDIDPIFDYLHNGVNPTSVDFPHPSVIDGNSVTGGYFFSGRYFFADFVDNQVYSGTFDESTEPSTFSGVQLTDIQDHTAALEASLSEDIDFVVSFGTDNAGSLFIIDFGDGFFPPANSGEIFKVIPVDSGVLVTESGGGTFASESGTTDSYTVSLTEEPTGNVEIMATAVDQIELSLDETNYFASVTMSFSDVAPQTVFVRAIDDSIPEGSQFVTITHAVTSTDDPAHYPLDTDISDVIVSVGDDDLPTVAHQYTFNGSTADDSVGSADGTLVGTASIVEGELNLTGGGWGDGFVELPAGIVSAASANGTAGAISVEAWVTANSTSNWAVIFSFGNSGPGLEDGNGSDGDYWQLIPRNGGNGDLRSTTHASSGGETFVDDSMTLATGTEVYIANVLNVANNTNELYVDSILVGASPIHPGFDPNTFGPVGDVQNWLGRSQWSDPGLDARINELRIHNVALDQPAITDSFINGPTMPIILGDINCDGVLNLLDVQPFVNLISMGGFSPKADINSDGNVNLLDVAPFVALLSGG